MMTKDHEVIQIGDVFSVYTNENYKKLKTFSTYKGACDWLIIYEKKQCELKK